MTSEWEIDTRLKFLFLYCIVFKKVNQQYLNPQDLLPLLTNWYWPQKVSQINPDASLLQQEPSVLYQSSISRFRKKKKKKMVWLLLFSYHLGLFLWPISAELVRTSLITPLNRFFQFLLTEGGIILWTFTGSMTATRRWQDLFLGETPVWTESRERKVIHKTQEPERTWPLKIQPKPKHFYQTCINRECSSVYLFEAHFFWIKETMDFISTEDD